MAQPLARDEQGNVWDVSDPSHPKFVSHGGASPLASPTLPYEAPQAQADLTGKNLNNAITAATQRDQEVKAHNEAVQSGIAARAAQVDLNTKTGTPPGDVSKTGAAYLATLPPGVGDLAREMLAGKYKGSITTSRNPVVMQAALAAAHATEGQFDAGKYDERLAYIKSITDPNSPLGAMNTALAHAGNLYDQAGKVAGTAALGHTPLSMGLNALDNWWHGGDPGVTGYNTILDKYVPEQAKAYQIGTGAERTNLAGPYSINLPLDSKRADIAKDVDLFSGKISSMAHQFDMIGGNSPLNYFSPDALATIQKVNPTEYRRLMAMGVAGPGNNNPPPPPSNGGTPPPSLGGTPPSGPSGPHDYSPMVGGPQVSAATGAYRNEYDPIVAAGLNGLIHKGASLDEANAYLTSHGYSALSGPMAATFGQAVAYAKQPGHENVNLVNATKSIPTTAAERFEASPASAALKGFAAGSTAGLSDVLGRTIQGPQYDANRAALAATNPNADLAGNVAGGIAGMFGGGALTSNLLRAGAKGGVARNLLAFGVKHPVLSGVAGDTAYGTTYGAAENPDNPLGGALSGALAAPIASVGGQYLAKGVGAALQGVTDPAVQRLRSAGIPLTVGEVLGGGAKKAQDALTSVFGPGNMVEARYADGRAALNRAAFNEAGAPIGANIGSVGQSGIQALNAAKSNAYADALNPISLDLNNPATISDLSSAVNAAKSIPNVDQASDIAQGGLANYIGGAAPNGMMSGPDFQQAYRGLSRLSRQSSNRIYGHEIGDALGQGKDALVGALQQQNPGAYDAFLNANAANRNLNVLANAVNAAKNQDGQMFTPAQLGAAATANAKSLTGNIAAAAGQRPFNQLAIDSQKVMSSRLPDSGTATRALVTGDLLTSGGILAGLSGAGGAFGNQEGGAPGMFGGAATPIALLTLLGTRRGQQMLTGALTNRTLADQYTGAMLRRSPQIGGDILTAANIPLLSAQ